MELIRKRCWLRHRFHEGWNFCPLCNAPLVWVYDDEEWIPCDREMILFKRDLDGKVMVVSERTLKDYCVIYEPGMDGNFKPGLLPHVYSCDKLSGYAGIKIER